MSDGTSALGVLTSIAYDDAASSRKPSGAAAPAWHAVQIGVNTWSWIDCRSGSSGCGPPLMGWPFSSSPSPLPAQPASTSSTLVVAKRGRMKVAKRGRMKASPRDEVFRYVPARRARGFICLRRHSFNFDLRFRQNPKRAIRDSQPPSVQLGETQRSEHGHVLPTGPACGTAMDSGDSHGTYGRLRRRKLRRRRWDSTRNGDNQLATVDHHARSELDAHLDDERHRLHGDRKS